MRRDAKQDALIMSLLTHMTMKEVVEDTGLSSSAIYRFLRSPSFKARYDEQRRELLKSNCRALQVSMSDAIDTLVRILNDPNNSAQVRLNAVDMLLRHCSKLTEQVEIMDRLDVLEKRVNEQCK